MNPTPNRCHLRYTDQHISPRKNDDVHRRDRTPNEASVNPDAGSHTPTDRQISCGGSSVPEPIDPGARNDPARTQICGSRAASFCADDPMGSAARSGPYVRVRRGDNEASAAHDRGGQRRFITPSLDVPWSATGPTSSPTPRISTSVGRSSFWRARRRRPGHRLTAVTICSDWFLTPTRRCRAVGRGHPRPGTAPMRR
jgi:hypothetical protein